MISISTRAPTRLLCSVVGLLLASSPAARAADFTIDFKTLGTFTTPRLINRHMHLTADNGVSPAQINVLNLNGLGVVGGSSDTTCDGSEALRFEFDEPVLDVRYFVFVANNLDFDAFVGESFVEAFNGPVSLGVVSVNDTGLHDVTALFGRLAITRFTVRADVDGNRIDVLHYKTAPWVDLGNGLAGTNGIPELTGTGTLAAGSGVTITATSLLENHAALMVLGFSAINAPLFGGVMVPSVDRIFWGNPTGPFGLVSLSTTIPAGLPSGVDIFIQCWITDAAGPFGYAASNAIQNTTP